MNPTRATCVPTSFTMEGVGGTFTVTLAEFAAGGGFRCVWRTSDGADGFVVYIELSGTCAGHITGEPPYDSRKRRVSVSGGTRLGGAGATGGDATILKRVLAKAEAQGVGAVC